MAQPTSTDAIARIQECLSLVNDFSRYSEANQAFAELRDSLAVDQPETAEVLGLLWKEVLSARRSAMFWEQISQVEHQLTEQMAASHTQLQRNYLRLMQEQ